MVEFNYFCATRRELRRGQASTGTRSVRPAYLPNFSGPSLLPSLRSRPLPHSSFSSPLARFAPALFPSPTLLSAVVAAKVSFPLNLLREGRSTRARKRGQSSKRIRQRGAGAARGGGRRRMAEKRGNLSGCLPVGQMFTFLSPSLRRLSLLLIACCDANTSASASSLAPSR